MYQISTWSTKYCKRTTEKVWRSKYKKKWLAECHLLTLGKYALCRVPDGRHSAKCSLCRVSVGTLGKERANFFLNVCRVPLRLTLGKVVFFI